MKTQELKYLKFTLILFFCSLQLFSQNEGLPFIRIYTPDEYHGFFQNWSAEQDNRGVMYFGNGKGILEYDGKNWRRFFTEKISTVLSLGKDSTGRIYVGGEGEIGYLGVDSSGLVHFVSLMNKIPEKERDFSYVWNTYTNKDGVYFVTPQKIIRINKKETKIFKPFSGFFTAFMTDGKFFVQDTDKGLLTIENDSLIQHKGWNQLKDLRAIFKSYNNSYIGLSENKGLINFSATTLPQNIPSQIDKLKDLRFYKGIKLSNNNLAIATMSGGIIIINTKGEIIQIINSETGLTGNSVYALFNDSQGELWAMLSNGLGRIEVSSPFTIFDKRLGITGICQDIVKIGNKLLIATLDGLFKLNSAKFENNKFSSSIFNVVYNLNNQTFSVANYNNNPIICWYSGMFIIEKLKNKFIYHNNYELCVESSRYYKNLIFYGGGEDFGFFKNKNNKWQFYKPSKEISGDVYYILEEKKNVFWASTAANGIYKIKLKDTISYNTEVTHYDSSNGLPNGLLEVRLLNNELHIGTPNGIYQFNEKTNSFYKSKTFFSDSLEQSQPMYNISEGRDKSIWLMINKTVTQFKHENNKYIKFDSPFKRLVFNDLYFIYPDSNGITWIGTTDCIYRYDSKQNKKLITNFKTILSRAIYHKDTLFNGCYSDTAGLFSDIQPEWLKKQLPYSHNSLIFEYAAPTFDREEDNTFSCFLDGFDDEWSDYSTICKKEYTNIPEGTYIFRVKSKNIYEIEGQEITYEFTILAPWYRTYLAYFSYLILFIVLVYLGIWINTRRLKAANIKLEQIVEQRTEELRKRNQEILQQKEEIETQRDEIEAQRDNLMLLNEEVNQQKEEIEAQRDLVISQKDKIEEIHEELTSSIRYAQRIQNAVLPSKEQMTEMLGDHFVLFLPRDIVSGDFFWTTKINNLLIFCVADCTGHGVPGGFMSMLGISFLNEIVLKEEITAAADVLNHLRQSIIESLKQKEESDENPSSTLRVQDGMDISLCVLDTETLKLQFAGANNPLYVVNNNELIELKGDKMPIAIHTKMNEFTNHEFQLYKGDILYLISDGYADQFGGDKGRKFKYAKLKELFVDINNLPMNKQLEEIENSLTNWKGNYFQVDDITILGFKI